MVRTQIDSLNKKVLCIIPAYDEEATIGQVAAGALQHCGNVLVIDDGSQDQTAEMAEQAGASVIKHLICLGTGGALSTGFKAALQTDSAILVTMDGDGQHKPDEIPIILDPITKGNADVVVGSRFLKPQDCIPLIKRIGNKMLSFSTSLIAGTEISDSQSGFRAYRREVLEYATHRSRDYRWASETLILAAQGGFTIMEVPITARYIPQRRRGANIRDGFKILYSMTKGGTRESLNRRR